MTNEQKQRIQELRISGHGYSTIADALGLTKNQVSAYCRRNKLTGTSNSNHTSESIESNCCRCCGKSIKQMPGRKTIKFCSDTCRNKWWNTHLDQVKRKAVYEYVCPHCGRPFSAYGNSRRKYCSHECYIQARFKGGDNHG